MNRYTIFSKHDAELVNFEHEGGYHVAVKSYLMQNPKIKNIEIVRVIEDRDADRCVFFCQQIHGLWKLCDIYKPGWIYCPVCNKPRMSIHRFRGFSWLQCDGCPTVYGLEINKPEISGISVSVTYHSTDDEDLLIDFFGGLKHEK